MFKRSKSLLSATVAGLLAVGGISTFASAPALAGGGGLSWSQPQQIMTLPGVPASGSRLVLDGGKQYWAYTDTSQNVWLATNQTGTWQSYRVASGQASNFGDREVALAVQNGVAYVAWVDSKGPNGGSPLYLSYDPGGPGGSWTRTEVACDLCANNLSGGASLAPSNPSAAIAGGNLSLAFYGSPQASDTNTHKYDVYVLTSPLTSLPQGSAGNVSWQASNVTGGFPSSGGGYGWPSLASDGNSLDLTFTGNTHWYFIQGQEGGTGGTTWPSQPQKTQAVASTEGSVGQLGAGGGSAAALLNDPNSSATWALTNQGGRWNASQLNSDADSSAEGAAASGICGPAVAYVEQPGGGSQGNQVTVATFGGGQWNAQAVGGPLTGGYSNLPDLGLAATAGGYDLLYQDTGGTGLLEATGTCGPVVTSISPSSGPAAGGTQVTITGSGFTGATSVLFAGSTALGNSGSGGPATTIQVVSDTQITAIAPAGSGTVDVTVTGPGGTSEAVPTDQFTYTGSGGSGSTQGGSGQGGGNAPAFNDLGGYTWAQAAINALAAQGIVKGTGPESFDPAGQITRAQYAALMQRTFALPQPSTPVAFTDVTASSWEYTSVEALTPYMDYYQLPGGNSFHPNDPMDRQDVATVMVKILAASNKLTVLSSSAAQSALASVTDSSDIAPALQVYVATAIQAGLIKGFPDGSFQPQGILTRAQVAVLIQRLQNQFLTTSGGSGSSSNGEPSTSVPVVTSITPSSGSYRGGTPITITGSGFAQGDYVELVSNGGFLRGYPQNVQVVSPLEITAVTNSAGASPPLSSQVEVCTASGACSTGGPNFTYTP